MCPTRTRPRVSWLRLHWGMYLEPKTWPSCYQTGRGYRKVCRWDWRLWVLWRGSQKALIPGCFAFLVPVIGTIWFFLQESLDEATDAWGIKVERVEIKDVKLPQQLQRAMAAEAEASREARAKVKTGKFCTGAETPEGNSCQPLIACVCSRSLPQRVKWRRPGLWKRPPWSSPSHRQPFSCDTCRASTPSQPRRTPPSSSPSP